MRFSPVLPICREALGYPIGFATPDGLTRITERAEALGYFAVVPNEHLCTPRVLRDDTQRPPSFFEPLVTCASLAARTRCIRLLPGLIVLPRARAPHSRITRGAC
ncbi:MAG: LLM class flavin-dependent oxidoreductase [Chloroflexi bacterium]|nr:LLM class flavin-dependent oxidoreductase [Chloroflexota bacterium]